MCWRVAVHSLILASVLFVSSVLMDNLAAWNSDLFQLLFRSLEEILLLSVLDHPVSASPGVRGDCFALPHM
jgi:hypothetical protein